MVLAIGCGQTPDDDVDAGSDPIGGLEVTFHSEPEVPDSVGGDYDAYVDTARFHLRNFRAIGDAAPGDDRTRVDDLTLTWSDGVEPQPVVFPDAPAGFYSQVSAEILDYRITGTAKVNDVVYPFEISDTPPTPISTMQRLDGVTVVATKRSTIKVEVEFKEAVAEFDWSSIAPNGDGVIIVDANSVGIGGVRDELRELLED